MLAIDELLVLAWRLDVPALDVIAVVEEDVEEVDDDDDEKGAVVDDVDEVDDWDLSDAAWLFLVCCCI